MSGADPADRPTAPASAPITSGERSRLRRRAPIVAGTAAIVAVLLLGAAVAVRTETIPNALDEGWMERVLALRAPAWDAVALVMDRIGGGLVGSAIIPLLIVVVLLVLRRRWAALFYGIAATASVLAVQGLKHLFGRARPDEMLVTSDFGSFPSGHVANAATTVVALALVIGRAWAWAIGSLYVLLMMLSRTYLGAHWLTDTLGGLVLGAAVATIVWALLADRIRGEGAHAK